jgi:bifunctional non-homologous end joining protein LigD
VRTARASSQAANAATSNGAAAEKAGRTRARRLRGSTLPAFIAPHTAMAAVWPPDGDAWLYEIDFDGERVLARRTDRRVTLFTASGDDCTARYAAIARAVQSLSIGDAWLDGEAVAIEDAGTSGDDVRYALFDLMFADGDDLREQPLIERRERLELALADAPPPLVYSSELAGDGATLLREACGLGLAGLIAKRKESPYESGRTRSWLELKCRVRDEVGVQAAAKAPAKPARRARSRAVSIEGVRITNPDRPIARSGGATKLDVVRYHQAMARWLVPQISRRPLALVRCTGGDLAQCFFQKHMGREQGNAGDPEAPYVLLPTSTALIEAVQNGVFEVHTWGSSVPRIDRPDRITLDLDPDSRLAWSAVREAAAHVRALLDEIGVRWFIKTTGGKGLHFVLPIERRYRWSTVKEFAAAIARHLARTFPDVFTATMSKAERTGRVFVDYLRNAEGATAIAAYSLRARPELPVSMPIEWDQLADDVRGAHFSWRNAAEVVASRARDPWADYDAVRQRLSSDVLSRLA